jgi:HD-GYP domain-containing protein (c-di-GMP phosphodiesterase class II)
MKPETMFLAPDPRLVQTARAVSLVAGIRFGQAPRVTERVATLSAAIGTALELAPAMVAACEATGWLHDVGLSLLPDGVIGGLARDAAGVSPAVRTHPLLGEQAVARVPELASVAAAVRAHHERVDGAGYPDGLEGAAIPVAARVVAAAIVLAAHAPSATCDSRARHAAVGALRDGARDGALDAEVVDAATGVLVAEAGLAGGHLPRAA